MTQTTNLHKYIRGPQIATHISLNSIVRNTVINFLLPQDLVTYYKSLQHLACFKTWQAEILRKVSCCLRLIPLRVVSIRVAHAVHLLRSLSRVNISKQGVAHASYCSSGGTYMQWKPFHRRRARRNILWMRNIKLYYGGAHRHTGGGAHALGKHPSLNSSVRRFPQNNCVSLLCVEFPTSLECSFLSLWNRREDASLSEAHTGGQIQTLLFALIISWPSNVRLEGWQVSALSPAALFLSEQ